MSGGEEGGEDGRGGRGHLAFMHFFLLGEKVHEVKLSAGGRRVTSSQFMHTLTPLHDPLPPQENQLAVVDCLEDPDPHPSTPSKP